MASDELDALNGKFPGCETLAFADLATMMVLVTNSSNARSREALDRLCAEATLTLGRVEAPAMGDSTCNTALSASRDRVSIFLRAEQEPSDVLCCICSPEVDISAFLAEARPCLQKISGGA